MHLRATLLVVGIPALACIGPCAPPPADQALAFVFDAQDDRFVRLCQQFPALGVDALGRDAGRVMLAKGELRLASAPTDEQLDAAGLDKKTWQAWLTDLAVLDIGQVRRSDGDGVDFVVGMTGVTPPETTTWLRCAAAAPPGATMLAYGDQAALDTRGLRCDPLRPGWWVCRDEEGRDRPAESPP